MRQPGGLKIIKSIRLDKEYVDPGLLQEMRGLGK